MLGIHNYKAIMEGRSIKVDENTFVAVKVNNVKIHIYGQEI
jgi:hypothetical protein